MFNRRRRSYRKGPPANQIYVPHDQRNINQDPIPITTERQAQYYYKQLYNMGYIPQPPPPVEPPLPDIVVINSPQNISILFSINSYNQYMVNDNINSTDGFTLQDLYGNPLTISQDIQNNILNKNGFRLYPIIVNGGIGFLNSANVQRPFWDYEISTQHTAQYQLAAQEFYNLSSHYSDFGQAMCCRNGDNLTLIPYNNMSVEDTPDIFYIKLNATSKIGCNTITCLVVPT